MRPDIPPRPAVIAPFASSAAGLDRGKLLLQTFALSKNFGSLVTAKSIDLEVRSGVLHSIIGPNGAGKTTFFNMLSGALKPSGGRIVFDGTDVTRVAMHVRARLGIGRSFQILSIFPNLTVFENVRVAVQAQRKGSGWLIADAYAMDAINARTWSILDAVGLADVAADQCVNLPHGAKRLLEIGITLAIDSRLLLLDEPLAGLAEADRVIVADLIRKLAQTHGVLLIEHDIDRVLAISDRISVLHQGRMIADGKPSEVAANPRRGRGLSRSRQGRRFLGLRLRRSSASPMPAPRSCSRPPASPPAMAAARSSNPSISPCTPAKPLRCSAATASARRPCFAASAER